MPTTENRQALRSRLARDQIARAALTVFALRGYAAASMDDVCMAAGCSKGGLYHHFPTKLALLEGVVGRLIASGALLPPFDSAEGAEDPQGGALGRVLIEIWSEAARSEDLRLQLRAGYDARVADTSRPYDISALDEILRIGTLVQEVTSRGGLDASETARRLGIRHAA